jgi:RNA polymerase sigma-70 factor (ECF subfamily)
VSHSPAHDSDVSDVDLVRRLGDGDADALGLLYDRYGRSCYALALRITADAGFAAEVVEEVFLTLWRDPGGFDQELCGLGSWLLATTHHKAVETVRREERLRRRRAESARETERVPAASDDADSPDGVWSQLRAQRVREALRRLPENERRAIALAYFGGYTQREVAALIHAPLGTVRASMRDGMRRLGETLRASTEIDDGGTRS